MAMRPRCKVRGKYTKADGTAATGPIRFRPEHTGWWNGEIVERETVVAQVGDDGAFEADLVPSEAVGPYTVIIGGATFTVTVPTTREVRIETLIPHTDGGAP